MLTKKQMEQVEANRAAKAQAEAEEAQRLEAERERMRKAATANRLHYLRPIAAAVPAETYSGKHGLAVVLDEETAKLTIGGINVSTLIDETTERDRSFRRSATGRRRLSVGPWGSRKSFPERKDGTFDWNGIAIILLHYALARTEESRRQSAIDSHRAAAEALRKELALSEYTGAMRVSPSATPGKPVVVKIEWGAAVTVERAREIHAALVGLGLVTYQNK